MQLSEGENEMKKLGIVIPPRRGIEEKRNTRPEESAKIATATEVFLKKGGKITPVPVGASGYVSRK